MSIPEPAVKNIATLINLLDRGRIGSSAWSHSALGDTLLAIDSKVKVEPFDLKAEISLIVSDAPIEKRAGALFNFVSYIFHPDDPVLFWADSEVLYFRFLYSGIPKSISKNAILISSEEAIRFLELMNFIVSDDRSYYLKFNLEFFPGRQEIVADIVRFLITYNETPKSVRDAPSIKKAHYFFHTVGGFKHPEDKRFAEQGEFGVSWKIFSNYWSKFKLVCMFHFVDYYHFDRRLTRLPNHSDLRTVAESILQDNKSMLQFFGKAKYITERLRHIVDYRAISPQEFPNFPPEVKSVKAAVAGMTSQQLAQMAEYRS